MEFEVVFSGIVRPGVDRRQAIQALAKEFQLDFDKIRKLLSKNNVVIKRFSERRSAENLALELLSAGWCASLVHRGKTVFSPDLYSRSAVSSMVKVQSEDGSCCLDIPAQWCRLEGLNHRAVLQVGHSGSNEFLVVLRQKIDDLSAVAGHKEYCSAQLTQCADRLREGIVSLKPAPVTVAGLPASSGEVTAKIGEISVRYLIVCIDTRDSIFTLFFWCEQHNFDAARSLFFRICESFSGADNVCMPQPTDMALQDA